MNIDTIHAYFAGFFDGEGCVSFANDETPTPRITIVNTVREPLDMAKELFGGNICFRSNESHPNHKFCYIWNIGSRSDIERFLLAILPYVCIKRPQVKLVLAYLNACRCCTGGPDYLFDEEKLLRQDYARAIRILNSGTDEQKKPILELVG